MVLLEESPASAVAPRRHRRVKLVVLLSVALLVMAGGAVAATAVSFRYLHATPLSTSGGGWIGVDGSRVRHRTAGSTSALVVSPRPGHSQIFELSLENFSPVAQTVVGLTHGKALGDRREVAEPQHLLISSTSTFPRHGRVRYVSGPVTVPPGGQYRLRLVYDTSSEVWGRGAGCRATMWEDLSLQVKVGWFARTETLDFHDLVMEIQQPGKGC